jgi:hypothetical protein
MPPPRPWAGTELDRGGLTRGKPKWLCHLHFIGAQYTLRSAQPRRDRSAELVHGVVTFLYRSRHDARVRYKRPA